MKLTCLVLALSLIGASRQDADEREVVRLVRQLSAPEPERREEAETRLVNLGKQSLAILTRERQAIGDQEAVIRLDRIIARIEVADAPRLAARIPHYLERITSRNLAVRLRAVQDVGRALFDEPESLPPLLRLLRSDRDRHIRDAAFRALMQVPERLKARDFAGTAYDASEAESRGRLLEQAETGALDVLLVLAVQKVENAKPAALKLLSSDNVYRRFTGARCLLLLDRRDEGIKALKQIAGTFEHYYTIRAMEELVRLGHREYLGTLIRLLELLETGQQVGGNLDGSMHLLLEVLERATGVYHTTSQEWKTWWKTKSGADAALDSTPAPPEPTWK